MSLLLYQLSYRPSRGSLSAGFRPAGASGFPVWSRDPSRRRTRAGR